MKATLTFLLPKESEDLASAQHGAQYKAILAAIDSTLRNKMKYEELLDSETQCYQFVRDEIYRRLQLENIDL